MLNIKTKFRAFNKAKGNFVYMHIVDGLPWGKILPDKSEKGYILEPWQQITGLCDSKGNEIWEGDIVTCFDTAGEKVYDHKVELPLFYREIWSNNEHGMPADDGQKTKVEVIGNINQNPDLIK